ncbi:transporter, small conductance mechanosensitive ion channel MscS family protein [Prevotella sp. BV3P1]|uniref:mechanosensitive ion channel family protein n=1 Tax=Prevotellaceae TaxID=171552 RepID=UPI0003B7E9AA|nr:MULTISPECIES: mechanosensitive ion channel domain-containing protein [Prevotellaceae]ERT58550.1 transporter, small conductance mechanosensitive ion channel MscS family protein [Prevotella sp. BV3P1]
MWDITETMEQIRSVVEDLIQMCGITGAAVPVVRYVSMSLAAIFFSWLSYIIAKKLLIPVIEKLTARTNATWDEVLLNHDVLLKVCAIVPAVVIYKLLPLVFYEAPFVQEMLNRLTSIYITVTSVQLGIAVINSFRHLENTQNSSRQQYLQSFCGVLKIVAIFIGVIVVVALVIDKSPMKLFAGLGATSAVLMLVFKDTIEGLVAGIRLTSNDMIRRGDWITVPSTPVDGEVMEMTLTTVKVQNFDNTIVTVSPKTLVEGSFQNWKGMQESGGRRVQRLVYFDFLSIKPATQELKDMCQEKGFLTVQELKGDLTNLGLYRKYMENWLKQSPEVNTELTCMVRQLEATNTGLPIQFYFFLSNKEWIVYEHNMAEIMEWAYTMAPVFGLHIYERPSVMPQGKLLSR